jgi:3',5'-cyclic AMP phosphodiesterase CpdA
VIVPGNHDIPLHNVFARATAPFRAYRRAFANELEPFLIDQEIAVLGINTARALTFKNGRINVLQVERSCARLEQCGPAVTRVIVTHHPFDVLATGDDGAVIGRAGMAMTAFARCQVDLILSGHLHVGYAAPSAVRYRDTGWASLLVQAGTATSTRRRGEVNTFNLIRIDRSRIAVESLGWAGGVFSLTATARFQRGSEGWRCEPPDSQHTMSPPA